jgi:hypothetical protein
MVLLFKAGRLCHGVVVGVRVSFGWPARPASPRQKALKKFRITSPLSTRRSLHTFLIARPKRNWYIITLRTVPYYGTQDLGTCQVSQSLRSCARRLWADEWSWPNTTSAPAKVIECRCHECKIAVISNQSSHCSVSWIRLAYQPFNSLG